MQSKREVILCKVLDFLTKDNQEPLTLSNIANALDMGKSTLYEYFSNKDEMIKEAILLMIDESQKQLLNYEAIESKTFKEAFVYHMKKSFELSKQNRMMQNVVDNIDFVSIPKTFKDEIMNKVHETFYLSKQFFLTILQKGLNEGIIKENENLIRGVTIESLFIGGFVMVSRFDTNVDEEAFIEDLFQSLCLLINN